jgi:tight adherence protein B
MIALQIAVVLIVLASGFLLVGALMLTRTARLSVESHVNLIAPAARSVSKADSDQKRAVAPTRIDEAARSLFCVGVPYRWGMRAGALALFGIALVSSGIAWLLAYRMLGNSVGLASLLAAAALVLVPRQYLLRQQRQAEAQFMELFPNAIDMIIRMLRAGLPIVTAVRAVGADSPPPFSAVFAEIASQAEIGVPFEKALEAVSGRMGLQDFRFFSVAVTLQYATGGNLAATLENLSDIIRRRRAVRLKGVAATAEVRISAYVLGGLPIFTIGILLVLNPEYIAPLIYDPRGKYIVGATIGFLTIGIFTMRKLMSRVTAA